MGTYRVRLEGLPGVAPRVVTVQYLGRRFEEWIHWSPRAPIATREYRPMRVEADGTIVARYIGTRG